MSCGVRPHSVCSAMDCADLGRLSALAQIVEIPAGRTFIEEGMPADCFFNVTAGTARLVKLLANGRRQITGFADPGQFLGLAASVTYGFSAEAISDMTLCRFSRPRLRSLLDEFPVLSRRMLDIAGAELAVAQEQMLLLGRKTARERVASFLANRMSESSAEGVHLHLPMSRADIADYLGLTIETVSRTFTRLRNDGLIGTPTATDVVALDPLALASLASGDDEATEPGLAPFPALLAAGRR